MAGNPHPGTFSFLARRPGGGADRALYRSGRFVRAGDHPRIGTSNRRLEFRVAHHGAGTAPVRRRRPNGRMGDGAGPGGDRRRPCRPLPQRDDGIGGLPLFHLRPMDRGVDRFFCQGKRDVGPVQPSPDLSPGRRKNPAGPAQLYTALSPLP